MTISFFQNYRYAKFFQKSIIKWREGMKSSRALNLMRIEEDSREFLNNEKTYILPISIGDDFTRGNSLQNPLTSFFQNKQNENQSLTEKAKFDSILLELQILSISQYEDGLTSCRASEKVLFQKNLPESRLQAAKIGSSNKLESVQLGNSSLRIRKSQSQKVSQWVCYSQSQYSLGPENLLGRGQMGLLGRSPAKPPSSQEPQGQQKNEKSNIKKDFTDLPLDLEQRFSRKERESLLAEKPAVNSSFLLSKTLFERQNILQCYKERNLLRLFIAFCDSSTSGENPKLQNGKISFFTKFPIFGFQRVQQKTQHDDDTKMKNDGTKQNRQKILFFGNVSNNVSRKWQRLRFQLSALTPASLNFFQYFIIPYTFLFGVFYTFYGFSVSSTKTAKDFALQDQLGFGTQQSQVLQKKNYSFENSLIYSYSIEYHSLPYELLRLSHFSSKLFLVWGIFTIWKGVRPSKSTRNEYMIQTRLLTPRKNKKRFSDIEGIEKFLHGEAPVLKTLVDTFQSTSAFKLGALPTNLSFFNWPGAWAGQSQPSPKPYLKGEQFKKNFGLGNGKSASRAGFAKPPSTPSSSKAFVPPKGYLFIGPPGTGKTLLAQAVAGEAKVNLVCLSASEIQKQIDIGTRIGAIRLRNLFEQARKNTPCILFLDEIDAIGRARNESMDLKLFTEFLIQMDNFSPKDGFIVIGTTNFLSSLDSAFVRSGRFDRIIGLNYPGKQTRIAILKLYAQKGQNLFDQAIQWDSFGERTKGLSAADLAKVVNESSLFLIQSNFLQKVSTEASSPSGRSSSVNQDKKKKQGLLDKVSSLEIQMSEESISSNTFSKSSKSSLFSFSWLNRIFQKSKLIHTTQSLERGIERISHASKA